MAEGEKDAVEELEARFDKHDKEFLKFERVKDKRSRRPDLHAFLLLEEIAPGKKQDKMVAGAEHDEIWLDVDAEDFLKKVTEEQLIELIRCGVRLDNDIRSLAMFV